jgi:hypothetical protein
VCVCVCVRLLNAACAPSGYHTLWNSCSLFSHNLIYFAKALSWSVCVFSQLNYCGLLFKAYEKSVKDCNS